MIRREGEVGFGGLGLDSFLIVAESIALFAADLVQRGETKYGAQVLWVPIQLLGKFCHRLCVVP